MTECIVALFSPFLFFPNYDAPCRCLVPIATVRPRTAKHWITPEFLYEVVYSIVASFLVLDYSVADLQFEHLGFKTVSYDRTYEVEDARSRCLHHRAHGTALYHETVLYRAPEFRGVGGVVQVLELGDSCPPPPSTAQAAARLRDSRPPK